MDAKKFEKLCKALLDESQNTLFWKSQEYATDTDRLANFRQPSSMMEASPAEVCLMYQMKHIASIAKIAKESSKGVLPTRELLQEKCKDTINYTLLFYAAMIEMIEHEEECVCKKHECAEKKPTPPVKKPTRSRARRAAQPAVEADLDLDFEESDGEL